MNTAESASRSAAPDLLTVRDLRARTQLGRDAVYELIASGELPHIKVGRSIRVDEADYQRWKASAKRGGSEPLPNIPITLSGLPTGRGRRLAKRQR